MTALARSRTEIGLHRILKFAFLVALTALLMDLLRDPPRAHEGTRLFLVAAVLNLVVSGWALVLNYFLPLPALRPYYCLLPFERRLYQKLGVRRFQRFVNSRAYQIIWSPHPVRKGAPLSLEERGSHMRDAETAHIVALAVVGFLAIAFLLEGSYAIASWLLAWNLLLKVYPVMLQRYNRHRIEHILAHREAESAANSDSALHPPASGSTAHTR